MKAYSYEQTLKLQDNEIPAIVNIDTGEVIEMKSRGSNIPEGKQTFGVQEKEWRKSFDPTFEYLDTVLTDLELRVVLKLCRMAEMNTNSLKPLNDDTAIKAIAEEFGISRNKVTPMFKKFFDIGLYARFEVKKEDIPYTKYWILNPYLTFSGKLIKSDIVNLFKGTTIEKEYHKRLKINQ